MSDDEVDRALAILGDVLGELAGDTGRAAAGE